MPNGGRPRQPLPINLACSTSAELGLERVLGTLEEDKPCPPAPPPPPPAREEASGAGLPPAVRPASLPLSQAFLPGLLGWILCRVALPVPLLRGQGYLLMRMSRPAFNLTCASGFALGPEQVRLMGWFGRG